MTEESKEQTQNVEDVIHAERKRLKLDEQEKVSGIAISGGGIRSASFGLGVLQALVANNQLSKMDYMSTVSGGGYLGSALTWALKQGGASTGTDPHNFPLGKRKTPRDKGGNLQNNPANSNDNDLLNFIRLHGSYLIPTAKLDMVSFVAVVLRSIVVSLFVYIGALTVAMTAAIYLLYKLVGQFQHFMGSILGESEFYKKGFMVIVGLLLLVIILVMGFLYSLNTSVTDHDRNKGRYRRFIKGQMTMGSILKAAIACFVLGSLPYVSDLLHKFGAELSTASGSTLLGIITGLWQYKKARKEEKNAGTASYLMVYVGAVALFYGVLLFAYLGATRFFLEDNIMVEPIWLLGLVLGTILFGIVTNLNLIGPHHVWRNRLMEAFMPNKAAVDTNTWMPATEADKALMENMCDNIHPRPYHIINTNVILTYSKKVAYSGRGGDNFIISPLYCGSSATGWKSTDKFQAIKNRRSGITLATAMAASAAALNPNAAVSGEGFTRNNIVSILLSMLNLRLGYWTSNPSKQNNTGAPNFFNPGFWSELFRNGLTETNRQIQLSDGGHYENLALYELVRRKLDLIIVSDGGADPAFNFDDLANAVEKVRVDFGAKISFIKDYQVECILPGSAGNSLYQKKYDIAKHGFAIADIFYADGTKGILVYLKLAMIEDMSTDVFSYKGLNPDFPHQSTADQFFNEKQFEAYRELGYYIAWQMMESQKGKEIFV